MKKQDDKVALALGVVTRLIPGWSGAYVGTGGGESRRQLSLKEQEVYDSALAVLGKALKSENHK